jgi:hypothetical protein
MNKAFHAIAATGVEGDYLEFGGTRQDNVDRSEHLPETVPGERGAQTARRHQSRHAAADRPGTTDLALRRQGALHPSNEAAGPHGSEGRGLRGAWVNPTFHLLKAQCALVSKWIG